MKKFLHNNGLSLVFLMLFVAALIGQFCTGLAETNKERIEEHQPSLSPGEYVQSGHFLQATFENWESEFLQMALFVLLTISLRQKGSSESKNVTAPKKWTAYHLQSVKALHGLSGKGVGC